MSVRKKRAPKPSAYVLAMPVSTGTILSDTFKSQWIVGKPIAQGGFGCIYSAKRTGDQTENYVVKIEPKENGPLFTEVHFYMRACSPASLSTWINQRKLSFLGIPRYVASGLYSPPGQPGCRFLIMDRFTGDMESVLKQARLTSDQVILIACHVLNALEYLHSKDYAHADIKASNLLYKISVVEVTLVDFGLVHLFRINGKHTAAKPNPKFKHNGTLEFCSRDAHRGFPPSPRGDLEILLFNLIHWLARCQPGTAQSFTTGLPWGYLISDPKLRENASNSVKNQVAAIKEQAMRDIDCFFTQAGIPHDTDLSSFMLTVSQLEYDQTPDYELLRQHLLAFSKRMKSSVTNSSPKVGTPARPMKRLSTEHLSHSRQPAQQPKTARPISNATGKKETSKSHRRCPPGTSRVRKREEALISRAAPPAPSPSARPIAKNSSRGPAGDSGGVERTLSQPSVLLSDAVSTPRTPARLPPGAKRPGVTELPTRSSPRIRAMKQPASDEPNMTKSLRDIFSDSEEEFAQLVSPKVAELRRLEKPRYVTHVERKVLSPYNPPSECHSPSPTKKAEAAAAKQRQSGFCQTSPELLMLAKAEALGRRAAELANYHVYSKYS